MRGVRIGWAVGVLAFVVWACASRPPRAVWFKPLPPSYRAPAAFAACDLHPAQRLLDDGRWAVRLDCPDAILLLERDGGRLIRRDLR